ncbi:MAG: PAS domain S-box protein [Deltaproteobacteria bacterium]|nr:PAS domain S-box protein [Deltaproteobacteria bacterium]
MSEAGLKSPFGKTMPQIDPLILLRAIDQSSSLIMITDPVGAIIYVNPRFCEVTGYCVEEVLGQNPRFLKGDDGHTDYQQMWEVLTSGKEWCGEFHNRKKNNDFYWELASILPVLDPQGNTTHYLAIKEDITERKQIEEKLEQTVAQATQLAAVLEFRNAEISQQRQELDKAYSDLKMAQSQMLQREKMASIGQLAAGVAHEINNPIGFVSSNLRTLDKYTRRLSGYIALLEKALADSPAWEDLQSERKNIKLDFLLEDTAELIEESLDGSERVKKIVQNLKTFSRVDQAEEQATNLNECLESTIAIVWNEIKYKAELKKDFGELPEIVCNPQELTQVFTNILVNAAQAIEKNGLIKVSSRYDGHAIIIRIEDNGCGIAEEDLSRIFEPFFTTKEVGKGTGLGMSISYEIVEKHGGDIQVQSVVDEGTCFTLIFPLERAPENSAAAAKD